MKLRFASLLLLAACVTESDDSGPSCTGGKCDGDSAPRTLTVGADRRPVDGALIEIHLEPREHGRWTVIRETAHFDRLEGREVRDREALVEFGDCVITLNRIVCGDTVDDVVEITRDDDGRYDAAFVTPDETRDLGTGLELRHVRWASRGDGGEIVELVVDATRDGHVGTLRITAADAYAPEVRTLFTGAVCTVDAEYGDLACAVDERPVDGSLVELHVVARPYPNSDYTATVRTAGRGLNGTDYDHTERFDGLYVR